jgi:peptidoglycan lytic transglycosylase
MSSGKRRSPLPAATSRAARAARAARAHAPIACVLAACALAACAHTAGHPPAPRSTVREVPRGAAGAQEGKASWYGREQHGHLTANGEHFDMFALTAAHRTFPMNTRVRVTNLRNGRSVIVRINDRGPYSKGRIIDVSFAAARALDMVDAGVVPARVEPLR